MQHERIDTGQPFVRSILRKRTTLQSNAVLLYCCDFVGAWSAFPEESEAHRGSVEAGVAA